MALLQFVQLYNWYFKDFEVVGSEGATLIGFTESSFGFYSTIFIALALLINAGTLFYLAFSVKYKLLMSVKEFFEENPKLASLAGFWGYTGYGLAPLILGGLFTLSLLLGDARFAQEHDSLFYFLIIQPFGKALLSFIALGAMCYGLYFFLAAFYRWRKPV